MRRCIALPERLRTLREVVAELTAVVCHQRAVLVVLVHETRAAEVLHQSLLALYARVGDFAHLVALVALPALSGEVLDQRNNVARVFQIQERIPQIAIVVTEVDGQVEKVIGAGMVHVDELQQR